MREVLIACQLTDSHVYAKESTLVCIRIKDGEKIQGGLSSPNISGKITAYKYVLSESLRRAAERSSFGNSLRSFATVVLRVHCVPNRFVQRARHARIVYVPLYCAKKKKREDTKRNDRTLTPIDLSSIAVKLYQYNILHSVKKNINTTAINKYFDLTITAKKLKFTFNAYLSYYVLKHMLKGRQIDNIDVKNYQSITV